MATRTPPPTYTATAISYYDYYPSPSSPPLQTPNPSNTNQHLIYINGTAFPSNSKYARFFHVFPDHYPPSFERYIHREVQAELYATDPTNFIVKRVRSVDSKDVEIFVVAVLVWFVLQWIVGKVKTVVKRVRGVNCKRAFGKIKAIISIVKLRSARKNTSASKHYPTDNNNNHNDHEAIGKSNRNNKAIGRNKPYTFRGNNNGRIEIVLGRSWNEDVYEGDGSDVEDTTAMNIASRRKAKAPRSMWRLRRRLEGYGELTTPY